jgi:uncharacterized protein YndB with AHSA1/START domain
MFDIALQKARFIAASPEDVWTVLTTHEGYASWCSEIRSAVIHQEGQPDRNGSARSANSRATKPKWEHERW